MQRPHLRSVPAPAPCSYASHAELQANRARFVAETDAIGLQSDGDGGWIYMANCRACASSLAIELTEEQARQWGQMPPTREAAEAATKLGLTPAQLATALGVCATCAGDLVGGVCEPCANQRRGKRCCPSASRFSCFCATAWTCPIHGETHSGSHD